MIPFDEIDKRLDALGLDRKWLAESSGRKPDSIRVALAPNADPKNRTQLLQKALSDAIEREEEAQAAMQEPPGLGYHNIFLDDEQLDRADRASRKIGAESLAEFCRDAITYRTDELLANRPDPVPQSVKHPTVVPQAGNIEPANPQSRAI